MMIVSKLISIFADLFEKLLKIPALIYILIYIMLIFLFAFFYTQMPGNSFYHSTAKYEKNDLNIEADIIVNKLKKEIINNFNSHYKSNITNINGWEVDSKKFSIGSLDIRNYPKEINFTLGYILELNEKNNINNKSRQQERANITLTFKGKTISQNIVSLPYKTRSHSGFNIKGIPKTPKIESLIKRNPNTFVFIPQHLSISLDLYIEILNFGKAYLGFPSEIRNHYPRMLYFSASLATSNGLGDIVPITNGARLLVTVESIVMLILIALFLSSLAERLAFRSSRK